MRSCCLTQISIGIKRNTLTVIDLSAVLPQLIRDTDHFSIMLSDKFRKDGRLCGRLLAGALCVQSAELPDRCISRQPGMTAQVTPCHSERWNLDSFADEIRRADLDRVCSAGHSPNGTRFEYALRSGSAGA